MAQIHIEPQQRFPQDQELGMPQITDPDSRSMATSGRGSGVVGYNVQVAVDTEHHLIVTHEVTNSGSDRAQLANMAKQAKAVLKTETLEAVADRGYFSSPEILACHEAGITVALPKPQTSGAKSDGRFGKLDFVYLPEEDAYRCPAGERLSYRTDPTAYGGRAEDAFDLILPSMPGYGFSGKPTGPGWSPDRVARAWAELMTRLGYMRYVSQGGDWGAVVAEAMGRQAPAGLLGIHVNLPATIPPDVAIALATSGAAPAGLSDKERAVFDALEAAAKKGNRAYFIMMTARPQAIGYGLTDSPVGLAAWMLVHPGFAKWTFEADPVVSLSRDDVLDDITLYWLTNSATSSARLYWENGGRNPVAAAAQKTNEILLPVAITVFPEESYRAPETWARRAYPKLIYFHEVDKGGHFAAWEQPELFSMELRAAFKSLRQSI